jgi:ribonucleoside-diphosphate reductase alpha chain
MQTVEGAPHLKDKHLPIFDCANTCGKHGQRFIHYMGHVRMMAAAQPFLSGAISKTINMPNEATISDIENAYMESWKLGIKAMALYRDGSKLSQPLSSKSDAKAEQDDEAVDEREAEIARLKAELAEMQKIAAQLDPAQADKPRTVTTNFRPTRRTLPAKRHGFTQEARVAGHKIYLRTGEYEDGTLGEVFIDLHKEGATMRSIINCFAIAISKGLQYGVPLQEFVDTFTFTRFEPQGMVDGHPNIKMSTSIIDYVFRVLGLEYLQRTDLVQVPPQEESATNFGEMLPPEAKSSALPAPTPKPAPAPVNGNGNGLALKNGNGTNGHKNGTHAAPKAEAPADPVAVAETAQPQASVATEAAPAPVMDGGVSQQLAGMMGDAPFCDVCGHITVRNGACYKCLNCGNSLGCS